MNVNQLRKELRNNILFIGSTSIIVIIQKDTLKIVDLNESACQFYNGTYEELTELSLHDIDAGIKDSIIHQEIDYLSKHRISNGQLKDVKIKIAHLFESYTLLNITDITDIMDIQQSFEQIMNQNLELGKVLDNLPFVTWFKNVQGKYTISSKPLEEFCGHPKEDIIGHTDFDIFPTFQAERYTESDRQLLSGKRSLYLNEVCVDGVWREEYKCPVFDKRGTIIGTAGFNRDITDRKLKDKALHKAEQKEKKLLQETIELKDNFITLITHEFKTPIAIINAAVQTMETVCKDELSIKSRKYIDKIKINSIRQQRLVENLLDITKIKANRIRLYNRNIDIVSLTDEIVNSVKVFAMKKEIRVYFRATFSEKWVVIDDEKYERIIFNLLSNAIKYSKPRKRIFVQLSIEAFHIKLVVRDQGIGIDREKHSSIFDKFEQINSSLSRQAEGAGVGLYIVKSFTEALGGTISLKSSLNHGSEFTVVIPIKKEEVKDKQNINNDFLRQTALLELSDII